MSEPVNKAPRHQYEAFLRHLPADWDHQEITQLGTVVGGGTPSREVPSFWRGPIPWVTPGEVSGETSKLLHDTQEHISPSGLAGSGAHLLPAGSLLVTTRATLGARVINAVPMATNQGFKSIVFKKPEEASYYYHLFEKVKPELVRRASGTTFLEISGAEFGSIKLPSPSPEEKLKIAELLDTLDTAIHQTEAIVEKLKQVKQGLLHDLLTRGVDVNGQLRPSHIEAPELYMESPLGQIPKDWGLKEIQEIAFTFAGGTPSRDIPGFFGGTIPWVKSTEVNQDSIDSTDENITEFGLQNSSAKWVPPGTPLIAMYGATAGVVSWLNIRATTNQAVLALLPLENIAPRWLYWALSFASKRILASVQGSGQPNLSKTTIDAILLAMPKENEQLIIAKILDQQQRRLHEEGVELNKLRATKAGLMDDLLTGRVRVTPLLAQ